MHLMRKLQGLLSARAYRKRLRKSIPPPRGKLYYLLVGKRRLKPLEKKAQAGDVAAQAELGSSLLFGTHGKHDTRESLKWTDKALAGGSPYAKFLYGCRYFGGIDVPEDRKLAFQWWKESAEEGDVRGIVYTAWAYRQGVGTHQDPAEILYWLTQAALIGEISAQYRLGWNYACNDKGIIDKGRAYFWVSLATRRRGSSFYVGRVPNPQELLPPHAAVYDAIKKLRAQVEPEVLRGIENAVQHWRPGDDYPDELKCRRKPSEPEWSGGGGLR